jgi:hypothetical protein
MNKVQKPSNSEYYTPSSEPFRIYLISYYIFFLENRMFGTKYFIPPTDIYSSIDGYTNKMTHTQRNFSVWKWYVHVIQWIKFATLKTVDEPMFQNCSYTSVNFWQHSYTDHTISSRSKMKLRLFHFAWFHYHIYDEKADWIRDTFSFIHYRIVFSPIFFHYFTTLLVFRTISVNDRTDE